MPFFSIFTKTPAKPFFCFFKNIRNQPYLSSAYFSNTPAVPYFSNWNRIKPQRYLIPAFSISVPSNIKPQPCLSRTLFWYFRQYKNPVVPYFHILKRSEIQPCILLAFKKIKTLDLHYFSIFNNIRPQPGLIFAFSAIQGPAVP